MTIKIIFLAFVFISSFEIQAQNLVVNPGFETNTGCPGTAGTGDELALATGWHSIRTNARYYNTCANGPTPGSGVPSNAAGFQQAASGNAYAGIKAYKQGTLERGFIYSALSSPMQVGGVYEVKFKISLAENASLAVSNLTANFAVNTSGCVFNPLCPFPYPMENIPGLTQDTIRDDMNGWMEISTMVSAVQPFAYIILGVFDDIPLESEQSPNGTEAFYYIDDVSVTLLENMVFDGIPGCNIRTAQYGLTCPGGNDASISADVLLVDGPYSIHWSPEPGAGQGTTLATGLSAGTYTITVNTGYSTCSVTATILPPDSIALDVSLLDPSCDKANGSIHVSVADSTASYTYEWNTNPQQTTASIDNLLPGSYTLTVEKENGCVVSRTFTLVNTGLTITVDPPAPEIMPGDSIQLTASGAIEYQWTPPADLSCSDCSAPYASPPYTTDYVVTGTDEDGCMGSVWVRVSVWCPDLFIPTIFSPNGDGQNDYMCRLGGCVASVVFSIYDRWGEKVFETKDTDVCWDGSFKGNPAQPGAYVYRLKGIGTKGEEILQSGNITLVR